MYSTRSNMWHELIILAIMVTIGSALRLFPLVEFGSEGVRVVGTCGQLLDEARPLYEARNPLHFDVFFYPPVAPILVASSGLLLSGLTAARLDFAAYCAIFSVGVSILTLIIVYLIGREWGRMVAGLGMGFYAVTMIAVDCANTVQAYETFFSMLAILFCLWATRKPSKWNVTAIGVFLGLGIGAKYFPALLFLAVLAPALVLAPVRDTLSATLHGNPHRKAVRAFDFLLASVSAGCIGIVLYALIFEPRVLNFVQGYYNQHSHGHSFDYHLETIRKIYTASLVMIVSVGCIAA